MEGVVLLTFGVGVDERDIEGVVLLTFEVGAMVDEGVVLLTSGVDEGVVLLTSEVGAIVDEGVVLPKLGVSVVIEGVVLALVILWDCPNPASDKP
eukprot:3811336-Amphidinium_carterae.1